MHAIEDHVFLCTIAECLSDEERSVLTSEWLSETEGKKMLLMKDEKKRDEYLQSHAFMKLILSQKLKVSPSSISFYTNAFGKPFIAEEINQKKIFFNLSHTSGLTALIIANYEDVGVDVENMIVREDIASLEQIAFHEEELIEARRITNELERAENFYIKWVIKESILKAIGSGLSLDPKMLLITKDAKGIFSVRSEAFGRASSFNINYKTFMNCAVAYTIRKSQDICVEANTSHYNYSNCTFYEIK